VATRQDLRVDGPTMARDRILDFTCHQKVLSPVRGSNLVVKLFPLIPSLSMFVTAEVKIRV
jgi:hypothetical protein